MTKINTMIFVFMLTQILHDIFSVQNWSKYFLLYKIAIERIRDGILYSQY